MTCLKILHTHLCVICMRHKNISIYFPTKALRDTIYITHKNMYDMCDIKVTIIYVGEFKLSFTALQSMAYSSQ